MRGRVIVGVRVCERFRVVVRVCAVCERHGNHRENGLYAF